MLEDGETQHSSRVCEDDELVRGHLASLCVGCRRHYEDHIEYVSKDLAISLLGSIGVGDDRWVLRQY